MLSTSLTCTHHEYVVSNSYTGELRQCAEAWLSMLSQVERRVNFFVEVTWPVLYPQLPLPVVPTLLVLHPRPELPSWQHRSINAWRSVSVHPGNDLTSSSRQFAEVSRSLSLVPIRTAAWRCNLSSSAVRSALHLPTPAASTRPRRPACSSRRLAALALTVKVQPSCVVSFHCGGFKFVFFFFAKFPSASFNEVFACFA